MEYLIVALKFEEATSSESVFVSGWLQYNVARLWLREFYGLDFQGSFF